jgi:hypothetical protein
VFEREGGHSYRDHNVRLCNEFELEEVRQSAVAAQNVGFSPVKRGGFLDMFGRSHNQVPFGSIAPQNLLSRERRKRAGEEGKNCERK